MKLSDVTKLLKGPLQIEKVRCLSTGYAVEGPIPLPGLLQLPPDQLHLVELLAVHHGNLKRVGEELGISYPTLKHRLEVVSDFLRDQSAERRLSRLEILERIEKGEISPDEGAEGLRNL